MNRLKSTAGFSLIEVMFALLIMSILVVTAASNMLQVSKSIINAEKAQGSANNQQSGSYIRELILNASPTIYFTHIPVATRSCQPDKPCIRRFDGVSRKFVPNATVTSDSLLSTGLKKLASDVSSIQMFRDFNGSLATVNVDSIQKSDPKIQIKVRASSMVDSVVDLIGTTEGSGLYVTWPFLDKQSPGLPMLIQKHANAFFTEIPGAGSSNPSATIYGLFTAGTNNFDLSFIRKGLAVFFNSGEPTHFSVVYVGDAQACNSAGSTAISSLCSSTRNALNPSLVLPDPTLVGPSAIQVMPVSQSPLAGQVGRMVPNIATFNGAATSSWPSQSASSFFLFPMQQFSLYEIGSGSSKASPDLNPPIDVRKIQHYYTSHGSPSNLVLLPVELLVFKLATNPSDSRFLDLIAESSEKTSPMVVIEKAIRDPQHSSFKPPADALYFARKIGTTTIDVVIESGAI